MSSCRNNLVLCAVLRKQAHKKKGSVRDPFFELLSMQHWITWLLLLLEAVALQSWHLRSWP